MLVTRGAGLGGMAADGDDFASTGAGGVSVAVTGHVSTS